MRFSFTALLSVLLVSQNLCAQSPIGSWRALLNFSTAIDVDELGDEVYVATRNALFVYSKTDNSLQTLSRVNGLSDVGIVTLRAIPEKQTLLIGYENGNIDLLRNRSITNLPDVRNSSIAGNKSIRHAEPGVQFVYLSTGLGVLALDVDRREIRNTYSIVPNENLQINQTAVVENKLCAATSGGLYCGSLDADLTIFNNWEPELGLANPFGNVNHVAGTNQKLLANQRSGAEPGLYARDLSGGDWTQLVASDDIRSLRRVEQGFIFSTFNIVELRDHTAEQQLIRVDNYSGIPARPSKAIVDANGTVWVADVQSGLGTLRPDGEGETIAPDGPGTNRSFSIHSSNEELWVASGAPVRPGLWNNQFVFDGFYQYKENTWTNYTRENFSFLEQAEFRDITEIYRYPGTGNERVLVSSFFSGVLEMVDGEVVNHFTNENSTLTEWPAFVRNDGLPWIGVGAFAPDRSGNVWMLNTRAEKPLAVYRNDGSWESFGLDNLSLSPMLTHMLYSRQGQLWMLANRTGVVVYNPDFGGSNTPPNGVEQRLFTATAGSGGLPSNEVYCIAEDLDGVIWVGTNDGIGVFFSPFDALSERPSDARQIIVEQDGIFQPLFENQPISVIRIDGANRKWVGTYGSGVFLMSADGSEQIHNFTVSNSPLLSNIINDIAIDARTGEVYIATEQGLMVYTGDATQGQPTNNCTTVFPNPVRENYTGPIAIKGLMRDTEVRITDVRGNLVSSLVSTGGTATWDGRNLNNERVATGVYFALSSDRDGQSGCVSKILVIK